MFSDDFERPDAPTLGPSWNQVSGQFSIDAGRAHGVNSNIVDAIALSPDVGLADDVTAVVAADTDPFSYASVVARAAGVPSAFSGYRFGVGRQAGAAFLVKYVNVDVTTPGAPTWTGASVNPAYPYTIRLLVQGGRVYGVVNNVVVLDVAEVGSSPGGAHGGLWCSHSGEWFESFGVAPLALAGGWSVGGVSLP